MGYLVYNDYKVSIQDAVFQQWIASNDALRLQTEPRAQAKIIEYLVQKYDVSSEFQPTFIFNATATYQANALTQLNYTAWATAIAYTANRIVSYTDGNCYICILAVTSAFENPTNATFWTKIGAQLDLNYIAYPYPLFDEKFVYNIGDRVFWKGKIYQCLIQTIVPGHEAELNSGTYANQRPLNIFPNDPLNGLTNWGAGITYGVSGLIPNSAAPADWVAGTYIAGVRVTYNGQVWKSLKITDKVPGADIANWQSETWTFGDNRNQSILDAYVAIVLYILSPRISPRVLPQWVHDKYKAALDWLQMSALGDITLDVPEKQPSQGARIRFGGNQKQINGY